ncbi:putative efflux protein, MATE family [Methanococcoides vulcani]|uniref:Multidrug export protein MepA n=1 Tax=Methanococcoides vulcani TaxID=1353158 RepID=A0A1I0AF19_9EURY|nr:MATE family efflux transporter [Methanococcoides vulcani]SES92279.1 putative efflux protein, MATE family [Methanococcoides vulcani]
MHKNDAMLGNESIGNLIVKLSVPTIVGLLVQALYNLVDTIFVGRGLGEQSMLGIAGISVAFPVQILMMAIALGVGIGGSSIISRALGKKDIIKAERTVANMVTLVVTASVAFTALGLIFLDPMLKVFGASDIVLPFASEYTKYIVIGTTFFTFSAAMSNAIRAEGNTKFAMAIMLVSSVTNIILDPLFIFEFGMGIKGAAIATVISQLVGCVMVAYYYASSLSRLNLIFAYMIPDTEILGETISIGMSEFIFNVVESALFLLFNQSLLLYGGDVSIAVFGIIIKVFMLTLMPIIGIKQGIQPIVGYNYGANEYARVRKTISLSNYIVTAMCIVSTIIVFLIPEQIMRVFSDDPELISMGIAALKISFLMMPFIGYQVVATALLQSMGKSKESLVVTLSRQIIFLPPLVLILPLFFGLNGIWISFPISDFLACVVAVLITRKEIARMRS